MAWRPWERNHVTNIRDAGDKHQQSFETEAETRVRDGAVFPEVGIPSVGFGIDVVMFEVF